LRKERASLIKDKFQESYLQAVILHLDSQLLPNSLFPIKELTIEEKFYTKK